MLKPEVVQTKKSEYFIIMCCLYDHNKNKIRAFILISILFDRGKPVNISIFFQEVENLISYAQCMTISKNNQYNNEDMLTNYKYEILWLQSTLKRGK